MSTCSRATVTGLACVPRGYTHVVITFADPHFTWNGDMSAWTGSGLQFKSPPSDIRHAVDELHTRSVRVLLAVGGYTYLDWAGLAAEGHDSKAGPETTAISQMVSALDLDGIDVDYEVDGAGPAQISEYGGAIAALRRAVNLAGQKKILTVAAWSTGADCTPATGLDPCHGRASTWPGRAGRERLLFGDKATLRGIGMINVMSYDAGYDTYDAVRAWKLYRDLAPAKTIVNIGFEIAPEGWGEARLVANDADAQCDGSVVRADQFGDPVGRPYSIERLLREGPLARRPNSNPHDGAMLWNILKNQDLPLCAGHPVVSPAEFVVDAATFLDRAQSGAPHTASAENGHDN